MTYQTRNPKAVYSPLRSLPLLRSADQVLGWSRASVVRFELAKAERDVANARRAYVAAIEGLRAANRRPLRWTVSGQNCRAAFTAGDFDAAHALPASCRRCWQGRALRAMNAARRAAAEAEARLASYQAQDAALTEADAVPGGRYRLAA